MVGGSSSSRPLTPESVREGLSSGTPGRRSSSSSSSRSSSPGGSVGRPFSAPTVINGERLTPPGTPPFETKPLYERKIHSISPRSQMTTPTNPPSSLGSGEIDVEGGKLLFSSGKDGNLEGAQQDLLSQVSKKEESGEVKKGSTSACKKFFSEMGEIISSVLSNKTFQKAIGVIGLGILITASAVNPVLILGTVPFLLILTNGFVVEPPPYVPPSNSENKPKKDQQTQLDGNDPIAKDKPLGHANGHNGATGGKSTEELEEASRRDIDSRHRPTTRTIGTNTGEISELQRPPNPEGDQGLHFPPPPSLDSHEDEDEDEEERTIFSRTPSTSPAPLNSLEDEDEDEDEEISTIFGPTPSTTPAPLNSLEDEEKSTNFSPTPSPSPDYSLETTWDGSSVDTWEDGKESVSTGTLYYPPKFDTNERDNTGLSEFEASPSPSASIRIVHRPSYLVGNGSQDDFVVDIRSEPLHISGLDDGIELEQVPAQQPFSLAKPAVVQDQSADSAQDHIIEFARTVSEEASDKGLTVISIVTPRSEADDVLQNLRIHIEVPAGPEQPLDTESYLKDELLGEQSELKNQLLQAFRDKGVEGTDEQIIKRFAKDVQDQVRHISPLYKGDFPNLSTVKSLSHLHDQLKQQRFSEPDPSDWIKVQNILTKDIVNQFVQEALETGSVPILGSGGNVNFSRELRNKTMMKAMDNVGLPFQNENLEKPINKIGLDYCKKALNYWTEGMTRELSPKK